MHYVSFLALLYMEEREIPTTTCDSSKPMTTSTTPCMPMIMPAVSASSAFDFYPPFFPYYHQLYFPPAYPAVPPSLPLLPTAPVLGPQYIQQHQPSPAPSWTVDSPPPRSTLQFTSSPPGEAIVQPILPSQQNLLHPAPRAPRAPRPARASRGARPRRPAQVAQSTGLIRRPQQQRQQLEQPQQRDEKPRKRKRQSDGKEYGSPAESSSPASKRSADTSARSTPTPSSRVEAAIKSLETELGYLHGDYATICIMLDSLRTAFVPTLEPSGGRTDPDIEREKRVAFDDLLLQIRHLERNIEKLETDLMSKCPPPQKRLKKERST
ncbi:hypothetical protein BCR43DRAFT_210168 [Syncephalastrum racemosum]|uniref:Uncharacterized protein n=1 Tax=Syncephalastrum racemosum TaxID=13706 RepID=A0A1X2HIH8_SYNRA|nr:hypothetical protein BCR43DRAFT_210168 [Syncephalastrum racemosum]